MRRVIYSVAMSLDGYIAGPDGEYDWIPVDVGIDWNAFVNRFDTVLVGRRSFEAMAASDASLPDHLRPFVFSRTLRREDHPGVTIVSDDAAAVVADLRAEDGKEIWLFGGGVLFASLLAAGRVDVVEVAVVPILLGAGRPLLPGGVERAPLELREVERHGRGVVGLTYQVAEPGGGA